MGGRGRDAAHTAKARGKRAPFTDPRDGRLVRGARADLETLRAAIRSGGQTY